MANIPLSQNAMQILKARYLLRDNSKKIIETPEQMFKRVAKHVAGAEKRNRGSYEKKFFDMMASLDFLPNSPTLMNAGTRLGQLSACYVLPINDSIEDIFTTLKEMATVHQSGGGTGFSFTKLRPKGDIVLSTKGQSSGPVSFMGIFDKATEVIKQGGKRRGANIGILNAEHPDIFEFIEAKRHGAFRNFNISVGASKKFMEAVKNNENFSLVNPRTKKAVKTIKARKIFDSIARNAWANGDPGVIFLDEINSKNPLKLGPVESTNPCGEVPLYPYEACNLGSISLSNMAKGKSIDWEKLKQTARDAVRFLDDVIDANKYPSKKIEKTTRSNRKIGLGVMGFADMLIKLGIPYSSGKALGAAGRLMEFITSEARKVSAELGREKGSFPNFRKSILAKKYEHMRNATVTAIAPTGSISIIAGTSSGIEPLFAMAYKRLMIDAEVISVNRLFEKEAKRANVWKPSILRKVAANDGSLKGLKEVPDSLKEVFETAHDIRPEQHVKMQAAFQKYTDNAVSKTVNLPNGAAVNDARKVFLLAYQLKCKGITVYRQGSREEEVLKVCEAC